MLRAHHQLRHTGRALIVPLTATFSISGNLKKDQKEKKEKHFFRD